MALMPVTPIPARVAWDRDARRPRTIAWGTERLRVLSLLGIRDERHAYRSDRGPRLVLDLLTEGGRVAIAWQPAQRRWLLDAVDQRGPAAGLAA